MKKHISPTIIKVKDGQAYLHTSGWLDKRRNIVWEDITPLGSSPDLIKRTMKDFKCKIEFL